MNYFACSSPRSTRQFNMSFPTLFRCKFIQGLITYRVTSPITNDQIHIGILVYFLHVRKIMTVKTESGIQLINNQHATVAGGGGGGGGGINYGPRLS